MLTKLLLVSGSAEDTKKLTRETHHILRTNLQMGDQVEILETKIGDEILNGTLKNHAHPLVACSFIDGETRVEGGKTTLYDTVRGKHVVLVDHLFTPTRKESPNDNIHRVRGLLNLCRGVELPQITLATPYLPYVRAHSIPSYKKKGFHQFDSLTMMLKDFQKDGLDGILTIHLHSQRATQIAEDLRMFLYEANPFQSARKINPFKLGFTTGKVKQAKTFLKHLRPFQERFGIYKNRGRKLYTVSVDDGTESRTENFSERAFSDLDPGELFALVAYLGKGRDSFGDPTNSSFKHFSQINESNIDPKGIFIMADDMIASGGTADKSAALIKKGSSRAKVELWVSHPVIVGEQIPRVNELPTIDKIVCLDTVPQFPNLNVEIIPASAYFLAGMIYKTHQKLVTTRYS